jgi:hypothetical protein
MGGRKREEEVKKGVGGGGQRSGGEVGGKGASVCGREEVAGGGGGRDKVQAANWMGASVAEKRDVKEGNGRGTNSRKRADKKRSAIESAPGNTQSSVRVRWIRFVDERTQASAASPINLSGSRTRSRTTPRHRYNLRRQAPALAEIVTCV